MTSCIKKYKYTTTNEYNYVKDIRSLLKILGTSPNVSKKKAPENIINLQPGLEQINHYESIVKPIEIEPEPVYLEPISIPVDLNPIPVDMNPDIDDSNLNPIDQNPVVVNLNPEIPKPIITPSQIPVKIVSNYRPDLYTGGVQLIKNQRYRTNYQPRFR